MLYEGGGGGGGGEGGARGGVVERYAYVRPWVCVVGMRAGGDENENENGGMKHPKGT